MKQNTKQQRQQFKKETAVKNFRYNRYLFLRYMLAVFFFANLYWALGLVLGGEMTALLPGFLIVFSLMAVAEHVKLYGAKEYDSRQLHYNRLYHYCQLGVNLLMILISLTGVGYSFFFPFLETTMKARLIISGFLAIGSVISFACIKRMQAIDQQTDKHYQYIQEFEKEMK
ncbi:hypothetical protein [Enterococcus saccharolyticus]|uniref:PTS cellobiose transporter subunit IIA n=1 Tax=Enterococcus saccharolyticus subsp. saccharolyticus ATCC 43076 TaxID=1139996 RepID=S0NZ48_9ENTE|nr:hypothetical protein [Enterococcus saccharolyticus]EOT25670.1 hypothetical protein OMQ_02557 [Enterococcus saccharolyticus subsp. saccharolyticus ATCC 43076]EOT83220.1 hypothetical protein I572_00089 [Enterococcus saccharolyticus subsp. saccharolyticus ATCC 43076]OJG90565.1 hypothetical protein RV16_GL001514 [Enterococcus saccharolyticus]